MAEFYRVEAEIRQLHARYADAAFRKDVEAFGDCFAEDAEWRVAGQIMCGREAAKAFIRGSFPLFNRLFLTFRTPILDISGGIVTARTYVSENSQFLDGTPFAPIGIYYEQFVDEGDRWRFQWRLFQTVYVGPPQLTQPFEEVADYGAPPAMPPRDEATHDPSGVGAASAPG